MEQQIIKTPWYKNLYIITFLIILILAMIIRIYFFTQSYQESFWWDSAEYGLKAKAIAFGTPTTGWAPERELVAPYIFSIILLLGFGEIGMLVFQLLISIVTILMTYITISMITSKRTALISTFGMAFFWLHIFFTERVLLYLWAPLIFLIIIYFFYKGYIKGNKKYLVLFAISASIGLQIYFSTGFLLLGIAFYLLITEGFSLFKNKKAWLVLLLFFLILLPYMIYSQITFGFPIPRMKVGVGAAIGEPGAGVSGIFNYIKMFPTRVGWIFTVFSFVGLALFLYKFILEFSKEGIQKNKEWLLIFLSFLMPLLIYTLYGVVGGQGVVYDAFILPIFPFMFSFVGLAIDGLETKVNSKTTIILILIVILSIHAYFGVTQANITITSKISSYDSVKMAGLWIKDNSKSGDIVISMSRPQNTYYSERETIRVPETQQEFIELIHNDTKIKYFIVSVWETHPKWVYNYVNSNESKQEIIPIQAYFFQDKTYSLIIYGVNERLIIA